MELLLSALVLVLGFVVSAVILTNAFKEEDNNKTNNNKVTIRIENVGNTIINYSTTTNDKVIVKINAIDKVCDKIKESSYEDNTIKETKDDEYINFINNQINTAVHEEIIDCNLNESEIKELNIKAQELKDFMINDEEYKDYSFCELKDIIEMMICHMASNITRD